jgi:hypothetical protein
MKEKREGGAICGVAFRSGGQSLAQYAIRLSKKRTKKIQKQRKTFISPLKGGFESIFLGLKPP